MNIEEYVKDHPDRIEDLAYTLAQRREHLKLRSYCIVQDDTTPFQVSAQFKSQGPRQAAFVFTGQGAQWYVHFYLPIRRCAAMLTTISQGSHGQRADDRVPVVLGKYQINGQCSPGVGTCSTVDHGR